MSDVLIHRAKPSSNFTVIRNEIFECVGISIDALGLLTYLISRPANWTVSQMQLRKQFGIGRDKLVRVIKELEGFGYVVKRQTRDPATQSFGKIEFHVYDQQVVAEGASEAAPESTCKEPAIEEKIEEKTEAENTCAEPIEEAEIALEKPFPENPSTGKPLTGKPLTGKPSTGEPSTGKPVNGKSAPNKNINIINNNIYKTQTHAPPCFATLMAMKPPDRAAAMKAHGLTSASFGKTDRQMGINPRALGTDRRSIAKNGTPLPPDRQPVFVEQYSPQWEAWIAYRGKACSAMDRKNPATGLYQRGWWFGTEWPPATSAQGERSQGGRTGTGG